MSSDDPTVPGVLTRAGTGARLGLIASVLVQGLSIVATLVLARLFAPSDFGQLAVVNVVIAGASVLAGFGFAVRIVQRPHVDDRQISTAFLMTVTIGVAMTIVVWASASWTARVGGNPSSDFLISILALDFTLRAFGMVPRALLQRRLRFSPIYRWDIIGMIVYVALEVSLATAGVGPLSVVIGQLAMSMTTSLGLTFAARYRFAPRFTIVGLRGDMHFSSWFLVGGLVNFCVKNLDYVYVSRRLGAAALGVYYVAYVLPTVLRQRVTAITSEVGLAALSRLVGSPLEFRRTCLRSFRLVAVVGTPALLGLAILARPILAIAFGDQWTDATGPLTVISISALLDLLVSPIGPMLLAVGLVRRSVALNGVRLMALGVGLGLVHANGTASLTLVAGAVAIATVITILATLAWWPVLPGWPTRRSVLALLRGPTAAGVVMAAFALGVSHAVPTHAVQAVTGVLVGAIAYCLAIWTLDRSTASGALADVLAITLPAKHRRAAWIINLRRRDRLTGEALQDERPA